MFFRFLINDQGLSQTKWQPKNEHCAGKKKILCSITMHNLNKLNDRYLTLCFEIAIYQSDKMIKTPTNKSFNFLITNILPFIPIAPGTLFSDNYHFCSNQF